MTDVVDPATRSRMMSGIRSRNTKPELFVRSYLHRAGLRFRLHAKLPGRPDLVLPKFQTAIFVHGCFWHRHKGCRYSTTPSTNSAFWEEKFKGNVRRDARAKQELEQLGWKVRIIWSCQLSDRKLAAIAKAVENSGSGGKRHGKGR